MCQGAPQAPKTYQPTAAGPDGTWTPTKAYTQEERDAIMAKANAEPVPMMTLENGVQSGTIRVAPIKAQQQIADNAGQAAADAQKLAGMGQQAAKAANSALSRARTGGAAGGPTSLITGGTTATALASRKTPTSTLLGG